jgi:flagellar motor switch protein FliN/FliY
MADQTQTPPTPTGMPGQPPAGDSALKLGDLAGGAQAGDGALLQQADVPEDVPNAHELDAIYNIPVQLSAVLGKTTMQVSQLLKLGRGAVVELDRKVGEAIDIYVNNRLVARGEVVVVEERLGITMTEIIKGHEQIS